MTDEQLFKVTIGDGTNDTSLAKKFVQCAFAASTEETTIDESLDFNFPGMGTNGTDLKVATGIMEGTRNPIFPKLIEHWMTNCYNRKCFFSISSKKTQF